MKKLTTHDIPAGINELRKIIRAKTYLPEIGTIKDWAGADVIVAGRMTATLKKWIKDQPLVISFQEATPQRRVVVTTHHLELSWLLGELSRIASDRIDYVSKYDFYAHLALAALNDPSGPVDQLLLKVCDAAEEFLQDNKPQKQ